MRSQADRTQILLANAALALVTFVAFIPSFQGEFLTTWDDGGFITDNVMIRGLGLENLKFFFTEAVNSNYIPLIQLSWALDYKLFGFDVWGWHLHNIILHVLITLMVFRFLRLLGISMPWAFFGALFFGIHPMRVESVAWITERKDLLYSVYYLPALITYYHYVHETRRRGLWLGLTVLFFTLSVFSKVQAVALPLSLLLLDYYWKRKINLWLIIEKAPLFILSLIMGVVAYKILGQYGALEVNDRFTFVERLFFGLATLTVYIIKFLVPWVQSAIYPYPISPGESLPWTYYANVPLLLGAATMVFLSLRRTRVIFTGFAFFFVNLMFVLQIVAAGSGFMVDRYTYIPYIGLLFVFTWWLGQVTEKNTAMVKPAMAGLGLIALMALVTTWTRSQVWKNNGTLWTNVIEEYPRRIPTAYVNRASQFRRDKLLDQALADYGVAVSLDPSDGSAFMNRGNIYFDQGKDDLALLDYWKAMKSKMKENEKQSQLFRLYSNIGGIYGRRSQLDSANYYLDLSLALDSTNTGGILNKALTLINSGNHREAINYFLKYMRYEPKDLSINSDIGVCYQNLREFSTSIEWFDKAIAAQPENGGYYLNRSYSYNALQDLPRAREDAQRAAQLGAEVPPAYLKMIGL